MPPSPASPDSMGTVIPADTSGIDNSAAEAVTKQTDSGSSDEGDKNTINGNNMVLLGDTGSTIVYTDGSKVTTFEKYNRGDGDLQSLEDASGSYSNIVVGGGNRANLPPGASISLSSTSQEVQNALLYASYALGIVSAVLLVFFHLLALQRPPWLGGSSDSGNQDEGNGRASMGWFTPNVWELAVVVGYIQHVNSISMLDLTKAPQIVLDFTDSFSFANMHLSSVTTTAASEASRRLQLIILTGVVAFADRIGIDEDEALMTAFCFAFLTSSELSMHWRGIVAQGFVIFNAIVFFLFFARYVAMFVLVLKRWSGYTHRESFIHSQQSYEMEHQIAGSNTSGETPVFLTYDVREHRHLNDGGSIGTIGCFCYGFDASDAYCVLQCSLTALFQMVEHELISRNEQFQQ
ncbi:Mucin [Phytophthora palmivora]|uniref:Mucin n=1 Tax=Phytophthora palmivora TaxID=4796 RepID=A0A2P4XZ70_9STRA|nr:Mucin [Phytophthora palmivora]